MKNATIKKCSLNIQGKEVDAELTTVEHIDGKKYHRLTVPNQSYVDDIWFVCDTSGSMGESKMTILKDILKQSLNQSNWFEKMALIQHPPEGQTYTATAQLLFDKNRSKDCKQELIANLKTGWSECTLKAIEILKRVITTQEYGPSTIMTIVLSSDGSDVTYKSTKIELKQQLQDLHKFALEKNIKLNIVLVGIGEAHAEKAFNVIAKFLKTSGENKIILNSSAEIQQVINRIDNFILNVDSTMLRGQKRDKCIEICFTSKDVGQVLEQNLIHLENTAESQIEDDDALNIIAAGLQNLIDSEYTERYLKLMEDDVSFEVAFGILVQFIEYAQDKDNGAIFLEKTDLFGYINKIFNTIIQKPFFRTNINNPIYAWLVDNANKTNKNYKIAMNLYLSMHNRMDILDTYQPDIQGELQGAENFGANLKDAQGAVTKIKYKATDDDDSFNTTTMKKIKKPKPASSTSNKADIAAANLNQPQQQYDKTLYNIVEYKHIYCLINNNSGIKQLISQLEHYANQPLMSQSEKGFLINPIESEIAEFSFRYFCKKLTVDEGKDLIQENLEFNKKPVRPTCKLDASDADQQNVLQQFNEYIHYHYNLFNHLLESNQKLASKDVADFISAIQERRIAEITTNVLLINVDEALQLKQIRPEALSQIDDIFNTEAISKELLLSKMLTIKAISKTKIIDYLIEIKDLPDFSRKKGIAFEQIQELNTIKILHDNLITKLQSKKYYVCQKLANWLRENSNLKYENEKTNLTNPIIYEIAKASQEELADWKPIVQSLSIFEITEAFYKRQKEMEIEPYKKMRHYKDPNNIIFVDFVTPKIHINFPIFNLTPDIISLPDANSCQAKTILEKFKKYVLDEIDQIKQIISMKTSPSKNNALETLSLVLGHLENQLTNISGLEMMQNLVTSQRLFSIRYTMPDEQHPSKIVAANEFYNLQYTKKTLEGCIKQLEKQWKTAQPTISRLNEIKENFGKEAIKLTEEQNLKSLLDKYLEKTSIDAIWLAFQRRKKEMDFMPDAFDAQGTLEDMIFTNYIDKLIDPSLKALDKKLQDNLGITVSKCKDFHAYEETQLLRLRAIMMGLIALYKFCRKEDNETIDLDAHTLKVIELNLNTQACAKHAITALKLQIRDAEKIAVFLEKIIAMISSPDTVHADEMLFWNGQTCLLDLKQLKSTYKDISVTASSLFAWTDMDEILALSSKKQSTDQIDIEIHTINKRRNESTTMKRRLTKESNIPLAEQVKTIQNNFITTINNISNQDIRFKFDQIFNKLNTFYNTIDTAMDASHKNSFSQILTDLDKIRSSTEMNRVLTGEQRDKITSLHASLVIFFFRIRENKIKEDLKLEPGTLEITLPTLALENASVNNCRTRFGDIWQEYSTGQNIQGCDEHIKEYLNSILVNLNGTAASFPIHEILCLLELLKNKGDHKNLQKLLAIEEVKKHLPTIWEEYSKPYAKQQPDIEIEQQIEKTIVIGEDKEQTTSSIQEIDMLEKQVTELGENFTNIEKASNAYHEIQTEDNGIERVAFKQAGSRGSQIEQINVNTEMIGTGDAIIEQDQQILTQQLQELSLEIDRAYERNLLTKTNIYAEEPGNTILFQQEQLKAENKDDVNTDMIGTKYSIEQTQQILLQKAEVVQLSLQQISKHCMDQIDIHIEKTNALGEELKNLKQGAAGNTPQQEQTEIEQKIQTKAEDAPGLNTQSEQTNTKEPGVFRIVANFFLRGIVNFFRMIANLFSKKNPKQTKGEEYTNIDHNSLLTHKENATNNQFIKNNQLLTDSNTSSDNEQKIVLKQ